MRPDLLVTLVLGANVGWVALLAIAASAFIVGVGYGPITPASSHLLVRTTPTERMALTFSIKQTGVPAGVGAGGAHRSAADGRLRLADGNRRRRGDLRRRGRSSSQPLRARLDVDRDRSARLSASALLGGLALVARAPALRTMALVSFFYSGMQMSVSGFIVAYLYGEVGFGLIAAGTALTAANAAGVVGRIAWGSVVGPYRRPARHTAIIGFLMAAASVGAALISATWPMVGVLAIAATLGATAIGWNGVYLSEVARLAPPGEAGRATGGCLFFTFVGVVILPFLFGWLQRATGSYSVCFAVAAAVCAAVGVLLLMGMRRSTCMKRHAIIAT